MEEADRRALWLLYFCLVCVGIGQAMLFVILPPAAREIGLSEVQVSAIFAFSATIWFVQSPRWGRQSDRMGRRPVLLIGLVGFAVSMVLLATTIGLALQGYFSPIAAFFLMAASRGVFAIFGSGTPPAAQAYVADRTDPEERTRGVALINAAFSTGQMLGPAVGGGLVVLGLLAPVYFSALLALVSAAVIWAFLPETKSKGAEVDSPSPRMRFRDPRVVPFIVIAVLTQAVRATTTITWAFFLQDVLDLSSAQTTEYAAIGLSVQAAAAVAVQLVIVQRLRLRPTLLIRMGLTLSLVAFGVLVLSGGFFSYTVALGLLGMGLGLVRPGNSAGASLAVTADEQGAVAGLTSAVGVVGNIFGPLLATYFYDWSPRAPYLLNGALMVVALLFSFAHPRLRGASLLGAGR